MEAETSIPEDNEEEEDMERNRDNLGSRVTYLEKTMAEKQREMRKVQSQMTDLSAEVSSQMETMMNNFNTFVQNMEQELTLKSTAAAGEVNESPERIICA